MPRSVVGQHVAEHGKSWHDPQPVRNRKARVVQHPSPAPATPCPTVATSSWAPLRGGRGLFPPERLTRVPTISGAAGTTSRPRGQPDNAVGSSQSAGPQQASPSLRGSRARGSGPDRLSGWQPARGRGGFLNPPLALCNHRDYSASQESWNADQAAAVSQGMDSGCVGREARCQPGPRGQYREPRRCASPPYAVACDARKAGKSIPRQDGRAPGIACP